MHRECRDLLSDIDGVRYCLVAFECLFQFLDWFRIFFVKGVYIPFDFLSVAGTKQRLFNSGVGVPRERFNDLLLLLRRNRDVCWYYEWFNNAVLCIQIDANLLIFFAHHGLYL